MGEVRKRKPGAGRKPRGEFSGKSATLTTRLRPETRAGLEREAKRSKRSLSQEVEFRLRRSLEGDDEREQMFKRFGGRQNYAVCRLLAEVMRGVSAKAGKSWANDPWTFDQVVAGIGWIMREFRPAGETRPGPVPDLGEGIARARLAAFDFVDAGAVISDPWRDALALIKRDLGSLIRRHNPQEFDYDPTDYE